MNYSASKYVSKKLIPLAANKQYNSTIEIFFITTQYLSTITIFVTGGTK